ncbi:Cell surface A33 antigen [Saguinus oedipus]|uniref:Cell surface A33 antigen n=1 Tax=Saguinus oedipus TaxID=9490 RepID=A0ABQ9TJ77_SAGOE|nr:Cell surface A33 antigen [Saguinus oedipus]
MERPESDHPEDGAPGKCPGPGKDPEEVRVTVDAISVETPQDVLRAARGTSVTLPCTYHTSVSNREGFIQWDKLLFSHTERVVTWLFSNKNYIYGELYKDRVNMSGNAEQSDASITIGQLTMNDNGTYECSVSLMSDLDGTSKSRLRLLVLCECLHFFQECRKWVGWWQHREKSPGDEAKAGAAARS